MQETTSPSQSFETLVDSELIDNLYHKAYTAQVARIVTASAIAWIFRNNASLAVVLTWLAITYLTTFLSVFVIRRYHSRQRDPEETLKWGRYYLGLTVLTSVAMGVASPLFYDPENVTQFYLLTLILVVMVMAAISVLSSYPRAYHVHVIAALTPMIWIYLNAEDGQHVVLGFLGILFIGILFSTARINYTLLRDSICLRYENRDLIRRLTEEKRLAEKANSAKTRFLASASHDMRQPLHAIGLFLGVLMDRVKARRERLLIRKIENSVAALTGLLDSLLNISRLDAGVVKVNPEPFALQSLFDSLHDELAATAREKGLELRFVATRAWVHTDYHLLESVLRNLIANAIEYTQSGRVLVGCRHRRAGLELSVIDTGPGIPPQLQEGIFEEFYQINNPERDRSKGLGLGLSIVRRVARLLGTEVELSSVEGRGSNFHLLLPRLLEPETSGPEREAVPRLADFAGVRVLVIDDEVVVIDSLRELMVGWGCEVIGAGSGDAALARLREEPRPPDLILADYRLPEHETGLQAIERVQALPGYADIPAIVITGDTAPDRIREAAASGYRLLHKPVKPLLLQQAMGEVLAEGRY